MDVPSKVSFKSLDLGSAKPISIPMETVEVMISTENLLGDYARAFVAEARRSNPRLFEQVQLTDTEVQSYATYLLYKRIQCVHDECSDFRKLKVLYIPVWIQYNLAMIGEVTIRDRGLRMTPVFETEFIPSKEDETQDVEVIKAELEPISYEEALEISEKIGAFENDLQIVQDAMPRSYKGDQDVMTTALIAGYVRSINKVEHVASTYVTAFLGMKLREEAAFKVMYRIQYDDVEFIATALTRQKGLFR